MHPRVSTTSEGDDAELLAGGEDASVEARPGLSGLASLIAELHQNKQVGLPSGGAVERDKLLNDVREAIDETSEEVQATKRATKSLTGPVQLLEDARRKTRSAADGYKQVHGSQAFDRGRFKYLVKSSSMRSRASSSGLTSTALMGENCIRASVGQDGSRVQLTRDTGVQEDTWLQVRSEWGSAGSRAATQLLVPLERFLARRAFLGRLAKEAGVSIVLDEELRRLVRQANQDQAALRGALDGLAPLDPGALEQRLAGTRYTRELLPFQTRDLGRLLAMLHGANFSVPGAGKTTVTLATYEAERAAGRVERLLIVGPLSAFPAWLEETATSFSVPPVLHRFDGGAIPAPAEIVLANYHKLASNYDALARWVTERPTMVVLDEAHRMKRGWDGQWGSACLNLAYLAKRRDILTGTPAPQSTRDFVALMDYLLAGAGHPYTPGRRTHRAASSGCGPANCSRAWPTLCTDNQTRTRPTAGDTQGDRCPAPGDPA